MAPALLVLCVVATADGSGDRESRESRSAPQGVLLDFTATWCGPCQQMSPIVSKLERQGYPVRKVDIDQERQLAQQYGISSIPCFVLVVNGREVNRITGQTSEAQLRRLLAQIPTTPADESPRGARASSNEDPRDNRPAESRPLPVTDSVAGAEGPATKPKPKPFSLPPLFGRKNDREAAPADLERDIRGNNKDGDESSPRALSNDPLAASTRIRVRDEKGINFGTGTIVESKPGRTLILTCGHIFRDMMDDSTIEVDVFEGSKPRKYVGKLVAIDKEGDVGLISVPTDGVLSTGRIATVDAAVKVEDRLFSVGCSSGEVPSKVPAKVTALNRYYGPDNIECTGLPVPGRSGGGLFTETGELVGVCFAADQKEKRGLYAGLKPIHALVAKAGIPAGRATTPADVSPFEPDTVAGTAPAARGTKPRRTPVKPLDEDEQLFASSGAGDDSGPISSAPGAAANTARGLADAAAAAAGAGDAEVICIIRPLNQPQAASRVVIINRASTKFMNYLQGEVRGQPKPTSGRIEHARKPVAAIASERPERYQRSPESR